MYPPSGSPLHRIVIPCLQILAMDIRVVAFSIESVFIIILRASEGRVAVACVVCAFALPILVNSYISLEGDYHETFFHVQKHQ